MREKIKIETLLDWLYLTVFAAFIAYFFFRTTMFRIEWAEPTFRYLADILALITLFRMGYSKKYTINEIILCCMIIIPFMIAWQKNGYEVLFGTVVMIIGAKGISFRRILQVYVWVKGILMAATIICALTGMIENLVYQWEGRNTRIAFGFGYPTDFAAHLFFLMLCYFYLRNEKLKYIEIICSGLFGVFVYAACEARWNTVCFLGTMCVFLFHKTWADRCKKKGISYQMPDWFAKILAIVPVICAAFMIGFSMIYNSGNRFLEFLNKLTSLRLSYGKKGIDVYGFTLWGQQVSMHGNGGTIHENLYGFFLDSSYLSILLQYGLVVLSVVLFIWVCITFDALKRKDWILLWIVAIISVQCMIEHHMMEAAFNPFLWILLAEKVAPKKCLR